MSGDSLQFRQQCVMLKFPRRLAGGGDDRERGKFGGKIAGRRK